MSVRLCFSLQYHFSRPLLSFFSKRIVPQFFAIAFLLSFLSFSGNAIAKTKILILGDSLTAGYGLEKSDAFPSLLEQELKEQGYQDIQVINAGFSGSTSAGASKRLRWYLKISPDILILELGANDGLRGHKIESIRANLEDAIQMALDRNIQVLLAGMKMPLNYGQKYTQAFENLYPQLAKKHQIKLIPFLLEGVAGIPELNLADGIHPNREGHKIVSKTVLRFVLPLLNNDE